MAKRPGKQSLSRAQTLAELSRSTGMSTKEIATVLDSLSELINENLSKKGPGVINIPGLLKINVNRGKPSSRSSMKATSTGIKRNVPSTVRSRSEIAEAVRGVKAERAPVRARPLKKLKDMV